MPNTQSRSDDARRGLMLRAAAEAGLDADCQLWRADPLHTCSDRDGLPLGPSGKVCWANARAEVLNQPGEVA